MPDQPKRDVQRRLARTWEDVPATVRDNVRVESDGDLRRIELIDRHGEYSVIVHPTPMTITAAGVIRALGDDPRMREVVERTRPQNLSDWRERRDRS